MINKAKVVNNHFNLGDSFYNIATPAKFPRHILRFRNDRAAKLLDLDHLSNDQWVRFFGQFDKLPGIKHEPLALKYHGHQFGHYNPDLGDGRGFLLAQFLDKNDIYLIKLISPMTDQQRSKRLLKEAKGFVYYISATGITGSNKLDYKEINKNVLALKKQTKIPVLVGFGIKSKKDVLAISKSTKADGVIIGSALIQKYFDLKMDFSKYIISLRKFVKEVKI